MHMHKAKHSFRIVLASLICVAALAGCGAQLNKAGGGGSSPAPSHASEAGNQPTQSPEPRDEANESIEISVFTVDANLQEMMELKTLVQRGSDEEIVKAAVAELQRDGVEGSVSVWKDIKVLSVVLKNSAVTLDIEIPDQARLGAPGELQMIETLKSTLFQFPYVESIDVLVSGEAAESMMGHVELEHPYVR